MVEASTRRILGLDWPMGRRQPSWLRLLAASVVALGLSLLACWLLAGLGVMLFPDTAGYAHFGFADYAKLTTIGVLVSCLAWPVVTLASTRGARLLLWLAVLVTVVSFAPDIWILLHGQPADAVFILLLMHVALLVITYPALVLIAPQPRQDAAARQRHDRHPATPSA